MVQICLYLDSGGLDPAGPSHGGAATREEEVGTMKGEEEAGGEEGGELETDTVEEEGVFGNGKFYKASHRQVERGCGIERTAVGGDGGEGGGLQRQMR